MKTKIYLLLPFFQLYLFLSFVSPSPFSSPAHPPSLFVLETFYDCPVNKPKILVRTLVAGRNLSQWWLGKVDWQCRGRNSHPGLTIIFLTGWENQFLLFRRGNQTQIFIHFSIDGEMWFMILFYIYSFLKKIIAQKWLCILLHNCT